MLEEKSKSVELDETVVSAGRVDCKELPEFGVKEVSSVDEAMFVELYRKDTARTKKSEKNNLTGLRLGIILRTFIE